MDQITQVPVDKIKPQELQREVSEKGVAELALSIKRIGIIQPLLVAKDGDDLCLIAGQRRLMAARIAGKATVPCIMIHADHEKALTTSIAENLHRESLDPVTEAQMYVYLKTTLKKSNKDIAKMVSKSEAYISQHVNMLSWLPALVDAVKSHSISFTVGRELARVKEREHCHYLLGLAVSEGANYRTVRMWVREWEVSKIPLVGSDPVTQPDTHEQLERKIVMDCWWCGNSGPASAMSTFIMCPICTEQLKEGREASRKKQ